MPRSLRMADIARLAGVSVSTVSLVLRGKGGVGEATRARVLEAMKQLGYAGAPAAARRSAVVALLVESLPFPELADQYYADIIGGVAEEAQRLGYHLSLRVWDEGRNEADLLDEAQRGEFAGILVGGGVAMVPDALARLKATGVPLVLLDTAPPAPDYHCVASDCVQCGFLATQHLLALGHRRIGFLPGPDKYPALRERRLGYLAAMAGAGVLPPPEWLPDPAPGPRKGYHQMQALLQLPPERRPTAVVAVSDKAALGALEALRAAGVRVPDDMALVGIDDIRSSAEADPPLTTVRVAKREMGVAAARILQTLLGGAPLPPGRLLVPCELVVRASCGARRGEAGAQPLPAGATHA